MKQEFHCKSNVFQNCKLHLEFDDEKKYIVRSYFVESNQEEKDGAQENPRIQEILDQYFQGGQEEFQEALPLRLTGGTEFQRRVWEEIKNIPFGETRTYGQLAKTLGSSPRAVGNAAGKNPLGFLVPCHRVVSSSKKSIGGYSCSFGVGQKRKLLSLEEGFLRLAKKGKK